MARDMVQNNQVKSKKRVADHGEVFTAEREVNAMLDLVKQEAERIDSRFLEPSCGNGNFLAEILRRKLAAVKSRYGERAAGYERHAVMAVASVYGVELLPDNADECRKRMFEIFNSEYTANCQYGSNDETRHKVRYILSQNIICGDFLTTKKLDGSPIEFSEWRLDGEGKLNRSKTKLEDMLEKGKEAPKRKKKT